MGLCSSSRLYLDNIKGEPTLPQMSALQSASVAHDVSSADLTPDQSLSVARALADVPWATDEDSERVLSQLVVSEPATKKGRRSQQNWLALHSYFSAEQWRTLVDDKVPSEVKLSAMVAHLFRMGLRSPTEPTIKWLCSLWTVASTNPEDLPRLSAMTKALRLKQTKSQLDSFRRKATDPVQWVTTLPTDPVEFCRDFGSLHTLAFGKSIPSSPPISIDVVTGFDMSYGCRGGLKGVSTFGSPVRHSSSSASIGPLGGTTAAEVVAGVRGRQHGARCTWRRSRTGPGTTFSLQGRTL